MSYNGRGGATGSAAQRYVTPRVLPLNPGERRFDPRVMIARRFRAMMNPAYVGPLAPPEWLLRNQRVRT